jgi:hypothetical protein
MSQRLQLPDEVYEALKDVARANGVTPEAWIASCLPSRPRNGHVPTKTEVFRANAALRKQVISSGRPGESDNEQIDADLAKEYEDNHAGSRRREKR